MRFSDKWEVYNKGDDVPEGVVNLSYEAPYRFHEADRVTWSPGLVFRREIKLKRVGLSIVKHGTSYFDGVAASCELNEDGTLNLSTIKEVIK